MERHTLLNTLIGVAPFDLRTSKVPKMTKKSNIPLGPRGFRVSNPWEDTVGWVWGSLKMLPSIGTVIPSSIVRLGKIEDEPHPFTIDETVLFPIDKFMSPFLFLHQLYFLADNRA